MWSLPVLLPLVLGQVAEPAPSINPLRLTPAVRVAKSAGPAVVNISTQARRSEFGRRNGFEAWQRYFGRRPRQKNSSLGSGVIIDASGLVLTNEHVISGAGAITVTLEDRRTFAAEVIGADPAFDLAVLQIKQAKNLPAVTMGISSDLMPGEPVVAIGNPFGLANTVTTGVVSALHRSISAGDKTYEDFVQTDAAINPGNSGGALLNIEGKLIGINTAIHAEGTGIGFAIPIDKAKAVLEEVLRYGEVRPVYTGIILGNRRGRGALVEKVWPQSPAQEAGLLAGDLLLDLGGQEINSSRKFRQILRGLIPGQKKSLLLQRQGKKLKLSITPRELSLQQAANIGRQRLGMQVRLRQGRLVIVKLDRKSDAYEFGVRKGDQLLGLAGRRLTSMENFERICAVLHDAEQVSAVIGRRGRAHYLTLGLRP